MIYQRTPLGRQPMRRPLVLFALIFLFGCSHNASDSSTTPSQETGLLVAGCNFADLDQNYSYDIVVSTTDTGSPPLMKAVVYQRTGAISASFFVSVASGAAGSQVLETIASSTDGGAGFSMQVSTAVTASQMNNATLVHAQLNDGSSINNRGLLCQVAH
jgi:hypothetical protein